MRLGGWGEWWRVVGRHECMGRMAPWVGGADGAQRVIFFERLVVSRSGTCSETGEYPNSPHHFALGVGCFRAEETLSGIFV